MNGTWSKRPTVSPPTSNAWKKNVQGNREFDYAAESIRASVEAIEWPEVKDFLREFLPAFNKTLDELNRPLES